MGIDPALILDSRSPWAMLLAGLAGALILMLAIQSVIPHPPLYDELLHVLAARGVLATGEPAIAEGVYERAELFTRLVARAYEWRGESLETARLPALVSGVVLVLLTGAWVTRHAGLLAGTTSSVLLAVSATSLELSGLVRFYTLHAVVMLVVFVMTFEACAPGRSRLLRCLLAAVGLSVISIAWHLQVTTAIAMGAVVLGGMTVLILDNQIAVLAKLRTRPFIYLALFVGAAIVGIVLAQRLGIPAMAGEAPIWAARRSDDLDFYNRMLVTEWPLFWPLIPLAAFAAIAGFRRFGIFCVVIAFAAIAVHSLSAAKSLRYVFYAFPLLCSIVGCGVATGVKLLASWIANQGRERESKLATFLAITLVLAVTADSQEARRGAQFVAGKRTWRDLTMYASESDWRATAPAIKSRLSSGNTVVVSSGVKAVYYLGDYDYELNASTVPESESGAEFGRDHRTGRVAISTRASLARVLGGSANTLIVVDADKLGNASGVSGEVVSLIELNCDSLAVPVESRVYAWTCKKTRSN